MSRKLSENRSTALRVWSSLNSGREEGRKGGREDGGEEGGKGRRESKVQGIATWRSAWQEEVGAKL